jgi:metal-responsive CopG/Arc/MetJ family transcriptional regulator
VKTAVSIPDSVFEAADQLASRLKMSRSELYATALRELLDRRRGEGVTDALNRVYGQRESALDAGLARLQSASLPEDDW